MQWMSLASAVLGAAIGIASTLLADRARWRRDMQDRQQELRRDVYAEFLSALSETRRCLWEAARDSSLPMPERAQMARDAHAQWATHSLRIKVDLVAPKELLPHVDRAYRSMCDLRDAIEGGALYGDAEYHAQRESFHRDLHTLRLEMRRDLSIDQ
ncbi:hypothetical protein [Streptomyces sp. NPDC058308]|uniref:hypothetical protein n=1 Tax=Streptomyces sp. NPDC058308 TaxID=3346440 RepID=UPI0036EC8748